MLEANNLPDYFKSVLKNYKIYIIALVSIAIIASLFSVAVDYKIKEIIDAISSNSNANVGLLLILFVFYKLMHHGMFFIERLFDIKYRPGLLAEIIDSMYKKTVGHSLHWFDSHLSGEISSKISDFQNSVMTLFNTCFRAISNTAWIIISIIFLARVNIVPALVMIVFILVYSPIIALLLKKQIRLQEQYVNARQQALGIINDSIANIFGIKIIGNIWNEFKLKLTPAITKWKDWDKKTRQFDAYFVDNADTIMVTVMIAVQFYLLSYLFKSGQISPGGFAFVAMTTMNLHSVLDSFLENLLFNINPAIAAAKASFSFINVTKDTVDASDALPISNVKGEIKFEDVTFSYSGNESEVLKNLSVHIQPSQRIGIVGPSGAGKTTFIKCLLRYFDLKSGRILLDNHPINTLQQESLRANISVIPQDITMFHRSILENLQLAKYDASLDEIKEACKKARVHDDIMRMQNGYDSIVGERGVKVSGGQRQRIAIARAILKNAPILILDEATSALDTPTEKLIQESLNEMLETYKATTIVIAHRLSTLLHMDRILVFEHGKIIEDGTHQELLKLNGVYKALWDSQVGGFLQDMTKVNND
ncbi:MAG: ABC transporter ATP-binding protein/permease [Gammaproteobacteria bacterium]|nr:ABC transporter ATP-binding protein/permease [Gammaproteobacteria bacterium]